MNSKLLSRRDFSARIGSGCAGLSLGLVTGGPVGDRWITQASGVGEVSRTCEAIHQEVVFKASRERVYEALTEEKQFDKVSALGVAMQSGMNLGNSPTKINRTPGSTFTLFAGHILGRHIELIPNERIVQAWRVANWNAGVYSIAKFELKEEGSGTKLVFDHTGFPDGEGQHLAEGWKGNYWEPLAKYLG